VNNRTTTSTKRSVPVKARRTCDAKTRRALVSAMLAALQRSVVLLPMSEADEITQRSAFRF
jgi:hypothetical protein